MIARGGRGKATIHERKCDSTNRKHPGTCTCAKKIKSVNHLKHPRLQCSLFLELPVAVALPRWARTAKKVLVFDHSTPAHGFVHVSRALKHASKSLDVDFPSCEDLESVDSNLSAVARELVEVEKHLSTANSILSKLYNEEKQPTQWGAQYNESCTLLFKKDNANGQAFLDMLSESQAVKSTVSLYRE